MSPHAADCSCYKCHFDRTTPSPIAAFLAVLASINVEPMSTPLGASDEPDSKSCPLCGATSQDGCAENDCDNDWSDFWLPV